MNGEQPERSPEGGRREDDRKIWTHRIIVQTVITVIISVAAAFGGAILGTRTKTAVLESGFSELKLQLANATNEMRANMRAIEQSIKASDIKNAGDISKLQSDYQSLSREIDDMERRYDKKIADLEELNNWQTSRVDGVRDRLSRIEGEINATKRKE